MILRKYGKNVQSVEPNFDPRAMNEIGFRKNDDLVLTAEEFEQGYERTGGAELVGSADAAVQHDAEKEVLNQLEEQLKRLVSELTEGQVLVVESEMGKDYPKMRETVQNVVVGHENRMHFYRTVDPPLRIGIYSQRKS